MKNYMEQETKSLYREQFEHDNCGIGAVVNSKGIKSHKTVEKRAEDCRKPGTQSGKGCRRENRRWCRNSASDLS